MKYYFLPCLITLSIIVILICRYFKQINTEGFANKTQKKNKREQPPSNNCDCRTIDINSNNITLLKKNLSKSDVTLKDIQRKIKEMSNKMKKGQKQAAVIKQKSNNSNYGKQKKK